ncbi:MAG TPA: site-2 protease family protein [Gaiellaceae bacterium]|nr:site-2 protease family protein [Gaiellaceae bacterium]
MRDSLTLGRIAGIRFGVNWSWLIAFALIVWTLATGIFPHENRGYGQGVYVAMAFVAALLFFTSLLLHELGHALEAKREGVEIEGITLWLFGGVAKFKGMFESAGSEFRIAIAGPLVSLALGAVFVLLAWLAGLPEVADAVAAWLGYINLALLVFNLLPALPLDGGRVLRSALWAAKGELVWATHVAALIGRGFGYLFIVGGLGLVIWQSAYSGLWLAFIGWFLLQAAGAEDRALLARQALRGLRVGDVLVRNPVTTQPEVTIGEFIDDIAWSTRHATYPVTEDERVVGLLPLRCVTEVPRRDWETRTVRDCMLPRDDVPVVREGDDLFDAAAEISESDLSRALVLDGERLVGLLSWSDVRRVLELRRPRPRTS